jgi:hypothetical protein
MARRKTRKSQILGLGNCPKAKRSIRMYSNTYLSFFSLLPVSPGVVPIELTIIDQSSSPSDHLLIYIIEVSETVTG